MPDTDTILQGLNEPQREAVLTTEGPLLILAGAGSGKTRVITQRLAYLIASERARPWEVVAVTFTNKAAGEMKERVARLLGADAEGSRVATFHALCVRILRRDGARIGLPPRFQIYDTADQLGVLRGAMKDLGVDEGAFGPRAVLSQISHAKNRLLSWEACREQPLSPDTQVVALCYEEYQKRLRKLGGLDFDDLIMETLRLLDSNSDVAQRYASGCRYLLVDEYQDTNQTQYRLGRHLAARHRNICVVGDPDQSIYSWRGADIQNILDFEKDYPDARLIRLEQNYRSTSTILSAASAVIDQNTRRHPKKLWTENEPGFPVHYHRARDDRDEAESVVRIIASLSETLPTGEIAVLYRTNYQSRLIEEVLVRSGIRYRIVGSLRFYERKEIKDLLAYLRLMISADDDPSFLRAVNTPARGVGATTLDHVTAFAAERGLSLHGASHAALSEGRLAPRAATSLSRFLETMQDLRMRAGLAQAEQDRPLGQGTRSEGTLLSVDGEEQVDETVLMAAEAEEASGNGQATSASEGSGPVVPLVTGLIDAIGFLDHLRKSHPGDHEDRVENVEALVSAAAEYDELQPGGGLQGFLDRSSLRSDTDDVQGDTGVTLLTVHSAKGLEFSAVILTGLEENLFPHSRSSDTHEELEEERRLCYVAFTRAKKRLILTNAFMRRSFGDFVENAPSRFLDEIPKGALVCSESSPYVGVMRDPLRSGIAAGSVVRPSRSGGSALPSSGSSSRFGGSPSRSSGPGARSRSGGSTFSSGRGSGGSRPSRGDAGLPRGTGYVGGDDYAVGRIVTHPMFGRGTILHKEGAGDGLRLTIRFRDVGTKKILPRHTTLVVHD